MFFSGVVMATVLAGAPLAQAPDAAAAFERVKKLEGSWKTDGKDGAAQYVAVRLVANGTAVLQTTTAADRTSVSSVTVFALEGGELVASHHGAAGTSRFKLKDVDVAVLRFEGAGPVSSLALATKDSKLRQDSTTREGGREVKRSLELLREYVDTLK